MSDKPIVNVLLLINRMSKVMSSENFIEFCLDIENYVASGHSLIQGYTLALTLFCEDPKRMIKK